MFNSNTWPNSAPFAIYKALKSECPWLWPLKVSQGQISWCHSTFSIWFPIDICSNYMHISHRLAPIATQNIFSCMLPLRPNHEKSQVYRMIPKWPWTLQGQLHISIGNHICITSTHDFSNFTPFCSTITHFPGNWGFSFVIGFNGEFEMLENNC